MLNTTGIIFDGDYGLVVFQGINVDDKVGSCSSCLLLKEYPR